MEHWEREGTERKAPLGKWELLWSALWSRQPNQKVMEQQEAEPSLEHRAK